MQKSCFSFCMYSDCTADSRKTKPRANALGFVIYRAICEELLLQNNLAAQTGVCSDVLTAHLSVLERISL